MPEPDSQRSQPVCHWLLANQCSFLTRKHWQRVASGTHALGVHEAPENRIPRCILAALLGVLAASALAGCAAVQDISEQFPDEARFWGDHAVAAVLGDDPAND